MLYTGEPQQNRVAEKTQPYLNGYGEKHDKLLYPTDKFMDGGVKNCHSYSKSSAKQVGAQNTVWVVDRKGTLT